jgi:hypothetical protein
MYIAKEHLTMKKITAVILAVLSAAVILAACAKKNPTIPESEMPAALVLATAAPAPGALTPTPTPQQQALVLVDNCDGDTNQNQLKGLWSSYDDNSPPNFGNSVVIPSKGGNFTMSYVTDWVFPPPGTYSPTWPATNIYAARLQGTLNLKAQYNLIGMETGMNFSASPIDLSGYRQIIFWAKVGTDDHISTHLGNTHTPTGGTGYRFSLVSSNNPNTAGFDMYGATINPPTTWTQFVLNYTPKNSGDFGISFAGSGTIGWYDGDPADSIAKTTNAVNNAGLGAITHVTDLEMQTKTSATKITGPLTVDLWIDSIYLVRAN